jgi:hypothetical protein
MANDTAKTQTVNFLPVQGTFQPLPPYECINLIGPAGTPFYAPVNPNLDGVTITNSTINSTTVGLTTPAAAQFTTASQQNQPVGNNDLTTKLYVDSLALGISWKQPVVAATTGNLTLSGAPKTVDGVTVQAGERVLVKDQLNDYENGIYVAGSGPWARSADANSWDELISALVFVTEGGLAGSAWYCTAQPGGTLGVTAVDWNNFSVGGVYFAGTGLSLTGGDTFNIANTGVTGGTYGGANKAVTFQVNAQGQLTSASDTNIAIAANQITSGTIDSSRLSGTYSGITGLGTLTDLTVTNTISGSINGNAATATSATSATTATNLAGGATGSLPYQSASGTTAMLAAGTNGQYLTLSSGLPAWATIPAASLTISADTANATRYPVFNDAATGSASTLYTTSAKYTFNPSTGTLSTTAHYLDYLDFNTAATVTPVVGRAWWGATGTLNFRIDSGAGYDTQVNEQIFVYGKASSAITKGQLVIKTGVVGSSGVITMGPSTAGITDGNAFVGVAYEDIALNAFGRVVAVGLAKGFDLSAYNNNDTLWYDPAGGGAMTATKPSAPNIKAEIGIVTNNGSGGSGSMYVKIFPGSQLGGTDQNVQLSTPISDNSLLQYYSTGGYWRNVASSTVSVGTSTNLAGGATGSLPYQSTTGTTTFLAAGTDGQVLKLASGVPTWSSDTSGVTITDDTTTNATRYITFSDLTTGNETTLDVSSTKLTFNPSSGNVGIGATSLSYKLDIGTTSDASNFINIRTSTTGDSGVFFSDTNNGQGGIRYSHTSDALRFFANDAERMRIDSSGNVGIGTSSPSGSLDIQSTSGDLYLRRFAASTSGPTYYFDKSRNATVGSNTIVQSGDTLGRLLWRGANGTGYTTAAEITAEVDGTPGASNDMPGRILFLTTPDGSGTLTERMRIDSSGNIRAEKAVRATITADNDGSFDMNAASNFTCTPTGSITLTFTNITSGQTGNILLVNNSNYAVTAAATTKVASGVLSTLSATGTYWLSYYSNGTNVYIAATGALA